MTNFARLMEEAAEKFRQLRSEFDEHNSRRAECEDFQTHMMNAAAEHRRLEREAARFDCLECGFTGLSMELMGDEGREFSQKEHDNERACREPVRPLFAVPVEGEKFRVTRE